MAARSKTPPPFSPVPINAEPRVLRQHVRNISETYRDAPAETIRRGREWYPRAHDIAGQVGHGDVRRGAGMMAALSPGQDWDINIAQAHQMSSTPMRGHQVALLSQKAQVHQAANQAVAAAERAAGGGSQKKGAGKAPAHLYEQQEMARRDHMAVRHELFGGTPLNKQSTENILRAHGIQHGEVEPEKVLPMRIKTGNFFQNIYDPSNPHPVTVDTHAHDIAVDRKLPWKQNRGLSAVGRYDHFADAYRQAAHRVGEEHGGNMQAITWTAWRDQHGRKRGS